MRNLFFIIFVSLITSLTVFAISTIKPTTSHKVIQRKTSSIVNTTYQIKMDLSINEKQIASPLIYTKYGELSTITQKTDSGEFFIDVMATEGLIQEQTGIILKLTIGFIDTNGNKKVISKPQVFALENQKAFVSVGKTGNTSGVSLSLEAIRKN